MHPDAERIADLALDHFVARVTNTSFLRIAFRREVGIPPGVYRRRATGRAGDD